MTPPKDTPPAVPAAANEADAYEEKNVHEIYQQIAQHFSSTRYKPWPIVKQFLQDLPAGAIGVDVGCGNGKYLPVNKNVFIIASDRSENLARIAVKHQPHSTIVADIHYLPHPDSFFDFALSIAVVHHLSSIARRVAAIQEVLRVLKPAADDRPGGRALIYAWALEQRTSRRGWDKGDRQDVMVPWVMKNGSSGSNSSDQPRVFHRYYHLYEEGELEREINMAGGRVLESGYEKDNWWAVATPGDK